MGKRNHLLPIELDQPLLSLKLNSEQYSRFGVSKIVEQMKVG
jgi:hypothetical protein